MSGASSYLSESLLNRIGKAAYLVWVSLTRI
jgi:hypothetical protein